MLNNILFLHGAGDEGYEADKPLVASLQTALGDGYNIHYPHIRSDESRSDFGWPDQIAKEINHSDGNITVIAHSLGGSSLLKALSEYSIEKKVRGIILIATPFWRGAEDWKQGLILRDDFALRLPADLPVVLYHARDDEEVPFEHSALYAQKLPHATLRELSNGGHQLNNDLTVIAGDVKSLSPLVTSVQ